LLILPVRGAMSSAAMSSANEYSFKAYIEALRISLDFSPEIFQIVVYCLVYTTRQSDVMNYRNNSTKTLFKNNTYLRNYSLEFDNNFFLSSFLREQNSKCDLYSFLGESCSYFVVNQSSLLLP